MQFVVFVLQGVVTFLARADFNNILDIVDKDLAVADVAGVEGFLYRVDQCLRGNLADDDIYLNFGKQACLYGSAAVVFGVAFLHAVAQYIGYGKAGYAYFVKSALQPGEFVLIGDNGNLGHLGVLAGSVNYGYSLFGRYCGSRGSIRRRGLGSQGNGLGMFGIAVCRKRQDGCDEGEVGVSRVAVLADVEALDFFFEADADADGLLKREPDPERGREHKGAYGYYAKKLYAQQAEAAAEE